MRQLVIYIIFFLFSLNASANVTVLGTNVCFGNQTTLTGSSTINDSLILSWSWDLDNDGKFDEATGKTINYIFSSTDTFLIGLKTVLIDGSSDSTAIPAEVIVLPLPDVNFQVDNLCQGKTAVYEGQTTIKSGKITEYRWDFNNDGTPDEIDTLNIAFFINGPPGSYITKLECVSDKNCKAFATKSTQVYSQPEADFSVTDKCVGAQTLFTNKSTLSSDSNVIYVWDFGDNQQDSDPENPLHTYSSEGAYTAQLFVIPDNNCRDTATLNITINPVPSATLQYDSDTILYQGESLTISVNGSADSYTWSDGSTGSSLEVTNGGNYFVTIANSFGCTTKLSTEIISKNEPDEVKVQNDLITPNNDGYNDYFLIEEMESYNICVFKVYNIWNEIVYSSDAYKNSFSGNDLPAGAYFYILKCDDKKDKIGNLNILK